MYENNVFTHEELIEAMTDKNMDEMQRNCILSYYGFTIHEILSIRHKLTGTDSQEERIKKQVETIVKDTIKNIKDF